MAKIRKTQRITREDVAFALELKSQGIPLYFIAHVLWKINYRSFAYHLKKWGWYDNK